MCWSVFFIRAMTPDPLVYFDSAPDSGYSLDNLAPSPPENFHFQTPTMLAWNEAEEEDFDYFTVYGSEVDHLDPSAVIIAHTTGTSMDVAEHSHSHYHLTATDFTGNEGHEASVQASGIQGSDPLPQRYALYQNRPNPGRSGTVIQFDLPIETDVTLEIFDAGGRAVRTLFKDYAGPGHYAVPWDGSDAAGEPVLTGVYFYRLEAAGFRATRKLLITK
jgi:hypothetical protein